MANGTPPYLNLPPNLTPLQQRSAIATPGVGTGGGLFRSDDVFDFYSNLLSNQLIDDQGNITNENLRESLLPIERQFITQQLGFEPTSTSDLLSAMGIDTSGPVTSDNVNEAFRNVFTTGRRQEFGEGGDRNPGGPQTGVGRIAAVSSPTTEEAAGIAALGPALAAALTPGLAPIAAMGALGAGASTGFSNLGDLGVVGGPTRPQMGTTSFRDTIGLGKAAEARGRLGEGISPPDRAFNQRSANRSFRGGDRGGLGGTPGADRARGRGGQGLGFAYGGLIDESKGQMINTIRGYATGGEIMPNDPTFMPQPEGPGVDDVSITAQTGEYVINRPAVEMFGPEFFDILNDMAMRNPGLEPKEVLKAATAMIPKSETMTDKAQPGDVGSRISSAIGQGSFSKGGLIGSSPPRI